MEKEDFDYQGKRDNQVEASNTIFAYCFIVAIFAILLVLIFGN